jgi:hypothetical protein
MRVYQVVLAVSIVAAGCWGGGGSGGGMFGGDCKSMMSQLEAAVAEPGTCVTDADCMVVGGQLGGTQTCDCAPFVLSCGGHPMGKNAPSLELARQLDREIGAECEAELASACDCGPSLVTCNANGRCVAQGRSCFVPDAGVP